MYAGQHTLTQYTHTHTFHSRPCHYVNHFLLEWYHLPSHKATVWITVQSPCLALLHRTLHSVKTPWFKRH